MRMAAKLVEGSEPPASESMDRNMLKRLDVVNDVYDSERERSDGGRSSTAEIAEAAALPEIPRPFSSSNHCEMFMRVRADLDMIEQGHAFSRAAQRFTLSPMIKAGSLEPLLSSKLRRIEAPQAELLTTLYPDLDNDSQAVATIVVFQMKVWELLAKSTR
ncbi:hypothetical protein BGZ91_009581 [Linnemannia elongata]|nr:hypothetical protein BGZ91_009581 [Linnemannia elongata]